MRTGSPRPREQRLHARSARFVRCLSEVTNRVAASVNLIINIYGGYGSDAIAANIPCRSLSCENSESLLLN